MKNLGRYSQYVRSVPWWVLYASHVCGGTITSTPKTNGISNRLKRSPAYCPPLRKRKASQVAAPASRKSRLMCQGPTKSMKRWETASVGTFLM